MTAHSLPVSTARMKDESPPAPQTGHLSLAATLEALELPLDKGSNVEAVMRSLIVTGCASLPLPGQGKTRDRWKALAQAGMTDLSLAKIYESHTDALAILSELGQPEEASDALLAVWASEAPSHPLRFSKDLRLSGEKKWCSGVRFVNAGLVTARNERDEPLLLHVEMSAPGVRVESSPWVTEGMRGAETASVHFEETPARVVGSPGDYLKRPGFWHGGAGVAAVWYGAAVAIGARLGRKATGQGNSHLLAKWGDIDAKLMAARALLLGTARSFDRDPEANACAAALRVRAVVESLAHQTIYQTTSALGPGPMVTDAEFSRRCADLQIFIRQCHAELDLEALGENAEPEVDAYLW